MKISILAAGIVALASAASVSAAPVSFVSSNGYTLSYDDSSPLGTTSSSFSSGSSVGFSWTLPDSFSVFSPGTTASAMFSLPDFTITANPGFTLSGPLTGFLGNLVFNEFGRGLPPRPWPTVLLPSMVAHRLPSVAR